MFEQTFKNIDDILYKDAGSDSELDYVGQTSWILFLKYLDELEQEKAIEASLSGKDFTPIIEDKFKWSSWAVPKDGEGNPDLNNQMDAEILVGFVENELFPYLRLFKQKAESPATIEYKIGEIFDELKNKIQSGYNLRDIIQHVDSLPFKSREDKHELSDLYETKIKNMGSCSSQSPLNYIVR